MSGRRVVWLFGVLLVIAFSPAFASDPPHWTGARVEIDCTSNCHLPHNAPGGTLNQSASNVNLCWSCHNTGSTYAPDLAIGNADKAVPGVGGTSHAFDVAAVHPTYNTRVPVDNPEMAKRVLNNNIVCSTCHDQHRAVKTSGGRPRISAAQKVVDLSGSGSLVSGGTYTGDAGSWYLVEITILPSGTPGELRFSKDNGGSWFTGITFNYDVPLVLDAFGATVTISSGVVVGERWEFSASYPFLRGKLDSTTSTFCRDCHNAWNMTDVSTYNNGNPTSHPVGIAYPAGTAGYRTAPLDGDGSAQDSNPTNDLKLESGTNVQCLTCHGIHFADSNTQTVDGQ